MHTAYQPSGNPHTDTRAYAQRTAYSTAGHRHARSLARSPPPPPGVQARAGDQYDRSRGLLYRSTAIEKDGQRGGVPGNTRTRWVGDAEKGGPSGTFIAESQLGAPSTCCTNGPASTLVQIWEPMAHIADVSACSVTFWPVRRNLKYAPGLMVLACGNQQQRCASDTSNREGSGVDTRGAAEEAAKEFPTHAILAAAKGSTL